MIAVTLNPGVPLWKHLSVIGLKPMLARRPAEGVDDTAEVDWKGGRSFGAYPRGKNLCS